MIGQISEHFLRKLERIIGFPDLCEKPRLRPFFGLGSDRCDIALYRRLNFEDLERRTMFSADLGFAFGGGSTSDDVGYQVATDNAGNVYVTGEFRGTVDFDPSGAVSNLVSNGGSDVFIAKYSDTGQLLWAKSLGGAGDDTGLGLTVDGLGRVYVTGIYSGAIDFDPGVDTDVKAGGAQDAFVLKLNATGDYLWSRSFVSTGVVYGYDLNIDSDGYIYVGGGFTGTTDFDPLFGSVAPIASNGGSDAYLAKLSGAGSMVWVKTFGDTGNDAILGLDVNSSGEIVTTGYYQSTVDFDPGVGVVNLPGGGGGYDAFVSKFDGSGSFLWAITAGNANDNFGRDVVFDSNDNIIYTGSFEGTVDFNPGAGTFALTSAGGSDGFVTKLDAAGNFIWAGQMGGSGDDISYGVDVDSANNVYLTGTFEGTADFDIDLLGILHLTAGGNNALFVSKLDDAGNLLWSSASQDTGDVVGLGIAVANDGSIYTTGTMTDTADLDPLLLDLLLNSEGGTDFFVQQLLENTTPTTSGISTVNVTEDAANTIIDLFAAFDDVQDADADLIYTIVGNTNPALFAGLSIDGVGGTLTLDYAANAFGTATIIVRAMDSGGDYVDTSFTVNVAADNDQPTTQGIGDVNVIEDAANSVIDLFDAFADVEDSDAALTYTIVGNTNPALFSSININGVAGTLTLDYADNVYGTGVLRVRATDSGGSYVETTFNVTVASDNDQPTTVGIGNITVVEDSVNSYVNLFAAFADVETPDAALVYSVTGNTNPGLFSGINIDALSGTMTLAYAADQYGTSNITVRARDAGGLFVETTFTVTVSPQNDTPFAQSDTYTLWQNSRLNATAGVLDNDSDIDGDVVQASLLSGPAHGQLVLSADGTFTYIPQAGFYGIDQFTYVAQDGSGTSQATTVTLSVARLPVATDDQYLAMANTPLSMTTNGLLKNDISVAGVTALPVLVEAPQHGTVQIKNDGSFIYIPKSGFLGRDSFRYKLAGAEASSTPAVVTIDVLPPPTVLPDEGDSGFENPFNSSDDLILKPSVDIVITSSGIAQSAPLTPYAYYANEVKTVVIEFGQLGHYDYEYYSGAGGGQAEAMSAGQYGADSYLEASSRDAESAGGGEELVADSGPLQLRVNSLASPVDDDLLLNSAYLEGDESAYVFDRIIQKGSTAQAGEQNHPEASDLKIAIDTNSHPAASSEAAAPWNRQSAQMPAEAVDEVWADSEEFLIQTKAGLFLAEFGDGAETTDIDQSVLAVIATTVAAGQISYRSTKTRRKSLIPSNYSSPSDVDPQR